MDLRGIGRVAGMAAAVAALCLSGCVSDNSGKFTDERDGKTYKTVNIGYQTWMAENLNYRTSSGSWCYDNDTSYCDRYGRLYDWETAVTACPTGWHLPEDYEWDELMKKVGAGYRLKAKHGWYAERNELFSMNNGRRVENGNYFVKNNGSDIYGFSALPGGGFTTSMPPRGWMSEFGQRTFLGVRSAAVWWTATEHYYGYYPFRYELRFCSRAYLRAYYRRLGPRGIDKAYIRGIPGYRDDEYINKEHGFSVRCVRDYIEPAEVARLMEKRSDEERKQEERRQKEEEQRQKDAEERIAKNSGSFTDPRDGKTYRTMVIGGKTWMAENLNYQTPSGSGCYDSDKPNCDIYGRQYDWNTAVTACPVGWHLSTRDEWRHLVKTVDGTGNFGPSDRAGKLLKAEYGYRQGSWWTATEGAYGSAFRRYIRDDKDYVGESNFVKDYGLSVRCVADAP